MWPFSSGPVVPVLRFTGTIGMATPLKQGLSLAASADAMARAFKLSKLPTIAVIINSPGGSPVQSSLIFKRLRQLADEHKKKIYVFCDDVAASGGYYLAVAGDEIYADACSIVGSIGVISGGFGFVEAIDKLGIDRRIYTSGKAKSQLDPFRPENPEDVARLREILGDIHDAFIGVVKDRRGGRLTAPDADIFSGAFWAAPKAAELGLIDGITDVRTKMQELHGPKVRLKVVPLSRGGLLSMLRRPGLEFGCHAAGTSLSDDILSTAEARALWSRYGL
ncbi:MAG: peptidase S49 [Alphaproteobacteria bacterium BRH_c36]|nr:MAG: peptidase S49 [Alphaproteobacteria bacterium BRH_c36]